MHQPWPQILPARVGRVHSRVLDRWLCGEPEPRDLLQPFPAEPMAMWPVSSRVNTSKNDDSDILTRVVEADTTWRPDGNSA